MNLLLLQPNDFIGSSLVQIRARRFQHIQDVHKSQIGDSLRVGILNGQVGQGKIVRLEQEFVDIAIKLTDSPPAALPLTVLLALPRPKMVKRCFQHLTALGVKKIILLNTYRVEKSFWQSPWLKEDKIQEQLLLGLEQARDTVLPEVILENRFKPFVEDRLPAMVAGKKALVAHPSGEASCPRNLQEPCVLAIGPEGGFIPYEVVKLKEAGFEAIHLGTRILRVETAVTALVSKLYD